MNAPASIPPRSCRVSLRRIVGSMLAFGLLMSLRAADPAPPIRWPATTELRSEEYDYDLPGPATYRLPRIQPATDGIVLGTNGAPVRLHRLMEGRVVLLSFIYTRCSDPRACLRATGVLSTIQRITRENPALAERLLLVTLSFDPAHDTPGQMARYGRVFDSHGVGADWLFLTARNSKELQPMLEAYGQRVDRRKRPGAYGPYQHNLRVYLVDPEKQVRNIYSFGLLDPRLVITDIQSLLLDPS